MPRSTSLPHSALLAKPPSATALAVRAEDRPVLFDLRLDRKNLIAGLDPLSHDQSICIGQYYGL